MPPLTGQGSNPTAPAPITPDVAVAPNAQDAQVAQARRTRRGVALALGATVLWSTTGLFIDPLTTRYHVTPVQLSLWRALLVTLALIGAKGGGRKAKEIWNHRTLHTGDRRPSLADGQVSQRVPDCFRPPPSAFHLAKREAAYYVAYGLIGIALFNVVWSASVAVNKAAVATAILYSAPVFVAFGARLLFREKITAAQGAAIVVNLSGCVLVSGVYSVAAFLNSPQGLGLGLASGILFAVYTLFGKGAARLGRRGTSTVLFYTFGIAAVGLLLWGLPTEGLALLAPRLDAAGWSLLVLLSFGPTLCAYALYTASLSHLPPTIASLLTTLEPPITAILALILLGRVLSPWQWLGTALIVAGVLLIQAAARPLLA